jgi:hypothetical protein
MTFSTGIGLTAVRFFEPLFRYLMLQKIYKCLGKEEEEESTEQEKQL